MNPVELLFALLPDDETIIDQQIERIINERLLATTGRIALTPELHQLIEQHKLNMTKRNIKAKK